MHTFETKLLRVENQFSKRERRFVQILKNLGYAKSIKALNLIKNSLNSENGHIRHDGTEYYMHCIEVAMHLYNSGYTSELILTVALLHDYIEDACGTEEEKSSYITEVFGQEIAKRVQILTKKKGVNYHSDIEEKENYLIEILKDEDTCLVKLSDRTLNFLQLQNCSLEHLEKQLKETSEFYLKMIKTARKIHPQHSGFIYTTELLLKSLCLEYDRYVKLSKLTKD